MIESSSFFSLSVPRPPDSVISSRSDRRFGLYLVSIGSSYLATCLVQLQGAECLLRVNTSGYELSKTFSVEHLPSFSLKVFVQIGFAMLIVNQL
jgi:hypothetical protein